MPDTSTQSPNQKSILHDIKRFRFSTNLLNFFVSGTVVFCTFFILALASFYLPLTWDEGIMNERAANLSFWFQRILQQIPGVQKIIPPCPELENVHETDSLELLFSNWGLECYCFTEEGHPHFPVFLNAVGQLIAPPFLPEIVQFRFGSLVFFSLTIGVVFYRLQQEFDSTTAFFGVVSILLIPRLFAHAQIAFYDSVLISAWLLSWAFFPYALKSGWGTFCFGCAVGLTMSSKFSGCGVLLPLMLWLVVRLLTNRFVDAENRLRVYDLSKCIFLTILLALLTFWLFSPRLWLNPITGMYQYFYLNTHRTLNIAVLFFGNMYNLTYSLPWYNTLAWSVITVPIGILVLFFVGLLTIIRDKNKHWSGLWLFLNMLSLFFLRALPRTPVHDGVRMFIPAFPFLAIIAGIGAAALWKGTFWNRISVNKKQANKTWGNEIFCNENMVFKKNRLCTQLPVLLIYVASLFNMFWYAPQWLSFYNFVIGGLPGAVRAGMEPTYYWDGLDDEVLQWLRNNTNSGDKIVFSVHSPAALDLYFSMKKFPIPFEIPSVTETFDDFKTQGFRYYILQRRPSGEFARDKQLMLREKPVWVKTIRKGGWGVWNLNTVPIIEIYEISH
ncbi:MAG: glycosyltransferase family 39 protein [Planctomycetaceae bacterium]|jgi:hypothetical protein|nr:glycosyltransferase family 39 protein [Planctomycetaceae bacterium]